MARNTKVSAGNRGKPITAFFALANKSSRQPGSSPNASSPRSASQARGETPQNGDSSFKSNNHSSINVANGAKGPTSAPMSPRRSERVKPMSLQPAAVISTLKRPRDPETQLKASNLGRVRTSDRRKSKFDSGSDGDAGGAVIYVTSPQKRKKARVSPPTELSLPSNSDMIPSSQSDEEELATADQLNGASTANRDCAAKRSKLPNPDGTVNTMAVDDDHASIVQDEVMKDAEPLKLAVQVTQMLTPPLSDLSSPPSYVAPAKRSTQSIIANIKARAYARRSSSPESDQFDFQDDLDSSDDEQLPTLPLPAPNLRNTRSTRSKGKQTGLGPSSIAATRYSLRNHSFSPLEPNVKTQTKPAKKGPDPFTTLLKEKHQAEKRGKGSEAIEKAELIVLQCGGKDSLMNEMEDEDSEEVSEWAPHVSSGSIRDILNARSARNDDSDLDLDEGDRKRILEEEGGKTVLKILEQDKAEKSNTGDDAKMSGIYLWTRKGYAESSAMAVDEKYQISGESSVVRFLNNSLTCGATTRTSLLLKMNLMSGAQSAERVAIASCLLDISLSPNPSLCTDAAVNTLTKFWSSSMQPSTSTILLKDILNCLNRFGIDSRILDAQNWEVDSPGVCNTPHDRDVVIPRLVTLITACARFGRLRRGEIPDISIAMMLIGMDAGTSPALRRDLTLAIDLSMRHLSNELGSRENEFACASRVLQLSASYSPVNKLRLLSLMSNGSGPSRRIADFVAYCMITNEHSPTSNMYTVLPPLADVLDQLQFYSGSSCKNPGVFDLHEGTDYIDLGFYVAILGVAVSNVKGYVSLERQQAKSASLLESPSKIGDKSKTDLQLLHGALETLHSKISDSRATHLERSRTKAAVKQLAMNIHYQREFWLRHSRENRSITLAQYFRKKN